MKAVRKRTQLSARDAATAIAANPTGHHELSQQIAALNELTAQQLRDEWRTLYRGQPPRLSRDLLIRTVAYRMQELAYGGLSKATQRKLASLTKELRRKGSIVVTPDTSLRSGTRLVREWRGRTHTVIVMENGFEYAGKTFSSLTKIAHAITGAHWSGPRFFGLVRKPGSNGQLRSDATGSPGAVELAHG
jgi:sugar/nucleoside kinase (ribokinase family)